MGLYHEVLQPRTAQAKPPVLIMLHGYGSNEKDLFGMASMLNSRFLIISARAPIDLPWGGYAWYNIEFDQRGILNNRLEEAQESLAKVNSFIEKAVEEYGGDPSQIWLMGFSQGCILSYALTLNAPDRYRGALALSGYLWEDLLESDQHSHEHLRYFISHGNEDEVIPIVLARNTIEKLKSMEIDHQYKEYNIGHGIDQECFNDMMAWLDQQGLL